MIHGMIVRLLLAWAFFGSFAACAAAVEKAEPFAIGAQFHLQSKVLAEKRTYIVHVPDAYRNSKEAYPVLVLLDPESQFALTVAAMNSLSGSGRIPEMIVVGVPNTDRTRDMTPSIPKTDFGGAPWSGPAGGADKFLAFIADELLPTIDRDYRTRHYRILSGHSLGGLFAVYALMNRPEVFNGYLALSPSLWWDDQALVKAAQPFLATHQDLRADLYMAMGSEGQQMLGGAYKLSAALEETKLTGLRWQFKRSPEQDHGTITYPATFEGLEALFKDYSIPDPVALFDQGGLPAFERHYAEVSQHLGYTVDVPGETYAGMAWELASRGRFAQAQEVGQKLLALDPTNPQTLSMLAQIAAMQKDDTRAIGYSTQAIQAFPGDRRARAALTNYKVDADALIKGPQLSAQELKPYLGTYHSAEGPVKVEYAKGKLTAHNSARQCELRPMTRTRFYCVDADVNLEFVANDKGATVAVRVERPGHVDEYARAH